MSFAARRHSVGDLDITIGDREDDGATALIRQSAADAAVVERSGRPRWGRGQERVGGGCWGYAGKGDAGHMTTYRDIALGITTFNRRRFVEWQGRSLKLCNGIDEATVVVIDDQSHEFTPDDLRSIYPGHAKVIRRLQPSGGADFALITLLHYLAKLDCNVLVILDSDLICSSIMLDEIVRLWHKTQGVLSLFNTPSHAAIGSLDEFVIKKSVGAAGWVMSKEIVLRLLHAVPVSAYIDYHYCEFLTANNIPLLCVKNSLVQHAGFASGQFSKFHSGDFGVGFLDHSPVNSAGINESIVFAMRAGFSDLLKQVAAIRQENNALKIELAGLRTKLGLQPEPDGAARPAERGEAI